MNIFQLDYNTQKFTIQYGIGLFTPKIFPKKSKKIYIRRAHVNIRI